MVEINPAEELALTLATIMLSYTASVPFEVVKLTLQSQPELMRRGSISPWEPLAGPADCFQRRVFTKTGLRAIWATDFLGVAMVVPRHVVSKGCDVIAMAPALQRWVFESVAACRQTLISLFKSSFHCSSLLFTT